MSISQFSSALVISGACYLSQEAIASLCTRAPSLAKAVSSTFTDICEVCANSSERTAAMLGPRLSYIASEVVFKNAWISAFVVSLLFSSAPTSIAAGCFLIISVLSWFVRRKIGIRQDILYRVAAFFIYPERYFELVDVTLENRALHQLLGAGNIPPIDFQACVHSLLNRKLKDTAALLDLKFLYKA